MSSDLMNLGVIYQTQTELAICVNEYEGSPDVWLPKSQCEVDDFYLNAQRGDLIIITASEALFIQKGLV